MLPSLLVRNDKGTCARLTSTKDERVAQHWRGLETLLHRHRVGLLTIEMDNGIVTSAEINIASDATVFFANDAIVVAAGIATIRTIDLGETLPALDADHLVRTFFGGAHVLELEVRSNTLAGTHDVPALVCIKVTNTVHDLACFGCAEESNEVDTVSYEHVAYFDRTRSTTVAAHFDAAQCFETVLVFAEHLEGERNGVNDLGGAVTHGFADEVVSDGFGIEVKLTTMHELPPSDCTSKAVIDGSSAHCIVGHVVSDDDQVGLVSIGEHDQGIR